MTTFAVSHAFLGVSYVSILGEDAAKTPKVVRLKNEEAKQEFLDVTLKPGDLLLLENGGASDKIALNAAMGGALVHRIPTFKISNRERVFADVTAQGWTAEDESPIGDETGDQLTARKARAHAILARYLTAPAQFVEQREADQDALLIQHECRTYRLMQKTLLASYLRLLSVYNDRYVLEHARERAQSGSRAASPKGKVSAQAALSVITVLLVDIPESERGAFMTKLGLDKIEGKKFLPKKAVAKMLRDIVNAMLEEGAMKGIVAAMAEAKKSIEKRLKKLDVYNLVFKHIPGCGPLIAARVLSAIVDIRRFEDLPALKAYAGYHHFEDGSRARRRAGKVSNWSQELKQAVWQFTQQVIKMPSSPWRARLDQRCGYELYKILSQRQLDASGQGLDVEILPKAFADRKVTSVNDITVDDLAVLRAHVDALRLKAGIASTAVEDESEEQDEAATAAVAEEVVDGEVAIEPPEAAKPEEGQVVLSAADQRKLAKLVKGVKMQALQKAYRWLGQQFLKHVFKEWRKAVGLPELPVRPPKPNASLVDAAPAAILADHRPVTWESVPYKVEAEA